MMMMIITRMHPMTKRWTGRESLNMVFPFVVCGVIIRPVFYANCKKENPWGLSSGLLQPHDMERLVLLELFEHRVFGHDLDVELGFADHVEEEIGILVER